MYESGEPSRLSGCAHGRPRATGGCESRKVSEWVRRRIVVEEVRT